MTLSTITISSIVYTVYATRTEVNAYLAVDPIRMAAWSALADTDDARGIYIVSATRRLDQLSWQGEKTGAVATQNNDWPRTGVVYPDGTSVSTSDVPQEVEDATALLAGSILLDNEEAEAGTSGTNTKKVKAGSAEVEFFRQQDGVPLQDTSAFNLVQQFLEAASTSANLGPLATGTDGTSTFTDIDQWGRSRGFP